MNTKSFAMRTPPTSPMPSSVPWTSTFPYDEEALVRRGEIVPRSVVAGRKLGEPLENSPSRSGVW